MQNNISRNFKEKKKIVIGNWKMNPDNPKEASNIYNGIKRAASRISNVTTIICPPYPFISLFKSTSKVFLGAQNIFYEEKGSYTGEVSALQLINSGVEYVIIGHSERRKLGEKEEDVAKKVLKAVAAGLTPIICIGEEVHDAEGTYLDLVKRELISSLSLLKKTEIWKVIIAYEPVWAVGGTAAMSTYEMHQMSLYIQKILLDEYGKTSSTGIPILYGGAVDATNASEIIKKGNIDGLLVGRESLSAERFIELLKAVSNANN